MKTCITDAINHITTAIVKIDSDEKYALGELFSAKAFIEKACWALNNKLHPEGTDGYVKLNEDGFPCEEEKKTLTTDDSKPSATEDQHTDETVKSDFDREMDFLKANLPNFSLNDLSNAYTKRGIPGGVKYLLDLAGATIIGDVALVTTANAKKLNFTVKNGVISENKELVRKHIVTLLGFVGYKLANCDISSNNITGETTFAFTIERKIVSNRSVNCYLASPFLTIAARILGII